MEFIILDLEWNNGYAKPFGKPINEIIEIGALRVDENLQIQDGFKQLVTPVLTGKLSGRVKQLTHISNEDLQQEGISFSRAIARFINWLGEGEKIFLTWSNTDIYILSEAFAYYEKDPQIFFMTNYLDAQKYCQSCFDDPQNQNQISLLNAANQLEIPLDEDSLHRALADCVLTAKCFIKCYQAEKIKPFIHVCDQIFFEKLLFKPFYVNDLAVVQPTLQQDVQLCPCCKIRMKRIVNFEFINNCFRAVYQCGHCSQKYHVTYRFKQQYDRLDIKKRTVPAKRARAAVVKKKPV